MAELFMNNSELKKLHSLQTQQQQYFYRLWCAKEALYKALPKCTQSETTLKELSYLQLQAGQSGWQLSEFELEGYQTAIVCKKHAQAAVITKHFIDIDTFQ